MSRNFLFKYILIFFSLLTSSVSAQDMIGLATSNYAGNNGWKINPGALADTRLKWDINIVSFDAFVKNNYIYMPNGTFTLFKLADGSQKETSPTDRYYQPPKYAYLNTNIFLPSILISLKSQTFGTRISARSMVNANKVPFHVAKFFYDGLDFEPQQNVEYTDGAFSLAGMGWMEYGFSYSGAIIDYRRQFLSAGFNLNFLKAVGGFYYVNKNIQYMVPNQDTIRVRNLDAEFATGFPNTDVLFPGSGTGIDLGFCYERKREYQWSSVYRKSLVKTYDYKLGVSLIDIGGINFSKNSYIVKIDNKAADVPKNHLDGIKNDIELDTTLNKDFNLTPVVPESKFKISLPTTLSVQYDRNLTDYYYWNLALIYPLTNYGKKLTRTRQLIFSPRYESKWMEFSLPMSLYNLEKVHVGLAFRLHSFFIGSDNVLPMLGVGRIYSTSIYFGFKISAFKERWTVKDKSMYLNSIKGIFTPFWRKRL